MSLVHEALEKAAREKGRRGGEPQPAPAPLPATLAPPPPRRSRTGWWVAGVALAMIGGGLWFAARVYRQVEQALTPVPAPAVKVSVPVGPVAPVTPPPGPVTEPRFTVTGIMRDPDGTFVAVVNGKMVAETHFVDGAVVKRIERDRVTLDVAGKETVLRLF